MQLSNSKIKNLITRALSLTLALTLGLTSPIQSFAGNNYAAGGNNGGGGNSAMQKTDNYKFWSWQYQGYRFYMIDKNFVRVTPVYDYTYTTVTDTNKYDVMELDTWTRFDVPGISPLDSSGYIDASWADLAYYTTSSTSEIPVPVKDGKGHGAEFREWFLRDLYKWSGGGGAGGGTGGGIIISPSGGGGSTGGLTSGTAGSRPGTTEGTSIAVGAGIRSFDARPHLRAYKCISVMGDNSKTAYQIMMEEIGTVMDSAMYMSWWFSELNHATNYYLDGQLTISECTDYMYAVAADILGLYYWEDPENFGAYMTVATQMLYTKLGGFTLLSPKEFADSNESDILSTNIPLADYTTQSEKGCPAIQMLQNSDFGFSANGQTFKDWGSALMTLEYYLVVEPTTWLYVGTAPGQYPAKGGRTYGSYYNLARLWKGNDDGGFYVSYMTELGPSCLTVDQDFQAISGNILPAVAPGKRPVSASRGIMEGKQGLSMHLYHGGDLLAGTSTWDEPIGDTPGPAPDDSTMLQEGEKTDPLFHANIVKFYEEYVDGELNYNDSFTREVTPKQIEIEDEKSYKVKDWYTSITHTPADGSGPRYDSYKGSMPNDKHGAGPGSVELTTEKTLYVLLVKETENRGQVSAPKEGDWTLSESRLTKPASTTLTDGGDDILGNIEFTVSFPSLNTSHTVPYDCGSCHGGHGDSDGDGQSDDCGSCHGCDITHSMKLGNSDATLYLKNGNKSSYKALISNISGETWGDKFNKEYKDNRGGTSAETDTIKGFDYDFIIHRAGYDKAMLYTGKEGLASAAQTANGNLLNLGFNSGVKGATSRVNGGKEYNLSLHICEDSTASDKFTNSVCTECNHTDDDTNTKISDHTATGKVAINTYAGLQNSTKNNTDVDNSEVMYIGVSGYNNVSGRMVSDGKNFSFIPYIKMQYGNLSTNKTTLVTGQYARQMTVNDYAEVAWKSAEVGNLHLTSNQWSTHAGALELSKQITGQATPNILLPGGALYSLDTKGSEQIIQVTTYQSILIGNGLEQANAYSSVNNKLTLDYATQSHNDYVQSVIDGLSNTSLKQYVDKNSERSDAFDGIEVYGGADISSLNNGSSKSSVDNKYYFKNDPSSGKGSGADENDLDAVIESEEIKFYTFYSDTQGNIHMAEVNSSGAKLSDKVILNKAQDEAGLSDSLAVMINNRTYVVTKLCDAIERNTGNDPENTWVSDEKWYNEAFNGITVMVSKTKLKVGLYDPSVRTSVSDPKLIPKQTSKGTSFTTAFISQFKTSNKSNNYTKENVIGTFKGKEIQIKDLDRLFMSNEFYIPDMNVQDLS